MNDCMHATTLYQVEVNINGEWCPVRPSGEKKPYRYTSAEGAEHMMQMCYPDHALRDKLEGKGPQRVRVVPVEVEVS